MIQIFAPRVAVRDCQTQTINPADLELESMQDPENECNHQLEPEASVTIDVREGEEDQTLRNSTDANKDRQEGEKPLNSTSAPGTGQIPGERQRNIEGQEKILPKSQGQIEGQADLELAAENAYNHQKEPEASVTIDVREGKKVKKQRKIEEQERQRRINAQEENPGRDPNAPDDPTANVKRVAKYAFGAAFIAVGIFVVLGSAGGGAVAAPAANAAYASIISGSAAGSAGSASVGAAAGLSFGGAATITYLYAVGEVTVGAVRYITRRKNRGPTKDADTQTDLDKSD